ncbi:helix-turn-helix domain-containing protein [Streptomyces sp. NPDC005077]|uniref:helix-turn-helix domain-containing protein n=1 Tax=Streptomyces sp. NPDC005077 TaxID=3154292 RepID=UPI0033AD7132
MVLLSVQGMPVARIAEVTFTGADRVRDVGRNVNADGFDSLYPKCKGQVTTDPVAEDAVLHSR